MEVWTEDEEETGAGQVGQSAAVQAVAAGVHQSGVVLVIRREEVTSDWLSFLL